MHAGLPKKGGEDLDSLRHKCLRTPICSSVDSVEAPHKALLHNFRWGVSRFLSRCTSFSLPVWATNISMPGKQSCIQR